MQKSFQTIFWCFTLVMFFSMSTFAQDNPGSNARETAVITGEKIQLNYQTVYNDNPEAVLFDNGPLANITWRRLFWW